MNKRIAGVKFQKEFGGYGDREYHFFVLEDVEKDDLVVVDTVNGVRLGKVSRFVNQNEKQYANKYIIQKVDMESYTKKVEEAERQADLIARLENEMKRTEETNRYKTIIKESSDESVIALAKEILKNLEN